MIPLAIHMTAEQLQKAAELSHAGANMALVRIEAHDDGTLEFEQADVYARIDIDGTVLMPELYMPRTHGGVVLPY